MLFGVFLTLGVAMLSVGLRTFQNSYSQKAGALGILVASFLAIFFITGSWVLGLVAAVSRKKNSSARKVRRHRIVFLR
jgi:hypothetical protein